MCEIGIVPTDLSVGDHFEAGFELVGDSATRHFVFGVKDVCCVTFSAIERRGGATKSLEFGSVADARIATGACKMQAGKLRIGRQTHANGLLKGIRMKLDETDGSVKAGVDLLATRAKATREGNRMQRPFLQKTQARFAPHRQEGPQATSKDRTKSKDGFPFREAHQKNHP